MPAGHSLQFQTDLTGARWEIQVTLDGMNAARQTGSGPVVFVNGMLLSYPESRDIGMIVAVNGTVPPGASGQVGLRARELDNSGNVTPGSLVAVNQTIAGIRPSPATTNGNIADGGLSPRHAIAGICHACSLPFSCCHCRCPVCSASDLLIGTRSGFRGCNGVCCARFRHICSSRSGLHSDRMFESFGRSIELFRTSWNILMADKKLLVFPILSGVVSLIVLATFVIPLILGQFFGSIVSIAVLFVFYLVSYFVVIFFNTALVSCVSARLQGKDMSVGEGIGRAFSHLTPILGWALISATVGIILNMVRERGGFPGQIAAAVAGGAWGLVTFFVVPVLVLEDKGVFDAIRESASLIKRTWGETIIGSGSIFLVFFIIGFIGFIGMLATLMTGSTAVFGIALILFIALVIVLAVVASAMQGIFVTALYTYARTGTVPQAFHDDLIRNAFVPARGGQI